MALLPFHNVDAPAPHVMPKAVYYGVFSALIFLTALTVATAQFDLGPFDVPVAMAIATIKALLVAGIFMHLAFDHKINVAIGAFSLVCFAIFVVFSLIDLGSRGYVDPIKDNFTIRDELVAEHEEKNPGAAPLRAFKKKKPGVVDASLLYDLDHDEGHH